MVAGSITVLFSYVGTICIAILAGMMIASQPQSKALALRVSFIFPIVMLVMLQLWQVELAFSRQLQMAGLSFAMFWAVYLLTLLVTALEAKPQLAEGQGGASGAEAARDEQGMLTRASELPTLTPGGTSQGAAPPGPFSLQALEGQWLCEVVGLDGRRQQKKLLIDGEQFSLDITPLNGEGPTAVRGYLKVEAADPSNTLALSARPPQGSPQAAAQQGLTIRS